MTYVTPQETSELCFKAYAYGESEDVECRYSCDRERRLVFMKLYVLPLLLITTCISAEGPKTPDHMRRQLLAYQGGPSSLLYSNHVDHNDPDGRRVRLSYTAEQHPGTQLLHLDEILGLFAAEVAPGDTNLRGRKPSSVLFQCEEASCGLSNQ